MLYPGVVDPGAVVYWVEALTVEFDQVVVSVWVVTVQEEGLDL